MPPPLGHRVPASFPGTPTLSTLAAPRVGGYLEEQRPRCGRGPAFTATPFRSFAVLVSVFRA